MGLIALFIDGGYLVKVLERQFGRPKIDFEKLAQHMAGGHELLRAYFYDCPPYQSKNPSQEEKDRYKNKRAFFSILEELDRYEVRQGWLKHRGVNDEGKPLFEQKGVDVRMAVDLVQLSVKRIVNHIALLTADQDFVPAIQVAKDEGVVVKLYMSRKLSRSNQLWACVDERHDIGQNLIDSILRREIRESHDKEARSNIDKS